MCFCHDYSASALISYFPFGVFHAAGATKTPKRRLIHTLAARANEITSLISHPMQSPVREPDQVYTIQVLKKRGGNHWKLPFSPQGPALTICTHAPRGAKAFGAPGVTGAVTPIWHSLAQEAVLMNYGRGAWVARHTALPVSAPSIQPFVFSGDRGSP